MAREAVPLWFASGLRLSLSKNPHLSLGEESIKFSETATARVNAIVMTGNLIFTGQINESRSASINYDKNRSADLARKEQFSCAKCRA